MTRRVISDRQFIFNSTIADITHYCRACTLDSSVQIKVPKEKRYTWRPLF